MQHTGGRPDAVVFDFVGTLAHPEPDVATVYAEIGKRFGSKLGRAQIALRFHEAYQRTDWSDARDIAQRESWRSVVRAVFKDVPQPDPVFDQLWTHFSDSRNWRLFPDVLPELRALRSSGFRLAIASNFDGRLPSIVAGLGLANLVEGTYCSGHLGHAKPTPAFFDAISRALEIRPHQLLMVGDDLQRDVIAAIDAGWQALQLVREAEASGTALRTLESLHRRWPTC